MADNNTIARPYANALFELANDGQSLQPWSDALAMGGQLLADDHLVDYLSNPELDDSQRLEFLTGLFAKVGAGLLDGSDTKGSNFLRLLLENGRVGVLPEIAAHFENRKAEVENSVDATVTSATALSSEQLTKIATALKSRLGRDVNIETEIDENLIGGAVIRAGDVVIDGSLRARLEGLANALTK